MRSNSFAWLFSIVITALAIRIILYAIFGDSAALADPIIHPNFTGLDVAFDTWLVSWLLTASGTVLYCAHVIFSRAR